MNTLQPLFATLAEAGYTACHHPRKIVNTAGDFSLPLYWCADCGAAPGYAGTMHYQREPLPCP